MTDATLVEPGAIGGGEAVIVDCRFDLTRPAAGREAWLAGHIPGALHLGLDRDLSAPRGEHGGRHPLPAPPDFAATLARCGIDLATPVIAYDDSGFAIAGRLWWMMRALGYRPPALLNGGAHFRLEALSRSRLAIKLGRVELNIEVIRAP